MGRNIFVVGAVVSICAVATKAEQKRKALNSILLIIGVKRNKCIFRWVNERLNDRKDMVRPVPITGRLRFIQLISFNRFTGIYSLLT